MSRFERWIVARRRAWLASWTLVVALAAPGLGRLGNDNSPEIFFLAGSEAVERYRDLASRFGGDEGARIAVSGEALWTSAGLAYLARLESEVAALPQVTGVTGLASQLGRRHPGLATGGADPAALRRAALADPLARALGLVSADGAIASVLVEIGPLPRHATRPLFAALDRLAAAAPRGTLAFAIGRRSLELALDDSSREVLQLHFPLLVAFAVALLAFSFRELSAVAVPLAAVGACEVALLGAMGWAGVELNLILALAPPLLFVIALASTVHLLIRCRALESSGLDARAATLATFREKGRALAYTGLSTAAGFVSLAATPVGPVRDLGIWAAAGMAIVLAAGFTLLPALLATVAAHRGALPERAIEARLERLGRRLAAGAARRRILVLTGFAVATLVALAGLPRLTLASNALTYLDARHPVRARTEMLERASIGVSTVELRLDAAPGSPGFVDGEALDALSRVAREVGARPPALGAVSAAELADAAIAGTRLAALDPAIARAAALPAIAADPAGGRALSRFLAEDRRAARITAFVRTVGFAELDPWRARAIATARKAFPGAEVEATGALPLLLELQRYLLSTLGRSLALTLPVLALVFWVLLRDAADVARALVPNLFPVAVVFGGMAWLGVPLDIATVMVASIVLGLAVDDTIHTLADHRRRKREVGERAAIVETIEASAPAYLLTGGILVAGFGVGALSDFVPIARFGLLSSAAIALAVLADLALVPALFARGPDPAASRSV